MTWKFMTPVACVMGLLFASSALPSASDAAAPPSAHFSQDARTANNGMRLADQDGVASCRRDCRLELARCLRQSESKDSCYKISDACESKCFGS